MSIKSAVQDVRAAMGPNFRAWAIAHSKTEAAWRNGPEVLLGTRAFDGAGKIPACSVKCNGVAFGQWLKESWNMNPELLAKAASSALLTYGKIGDFGEAVTWAMGRPNGAHEVGGSAAVKAGLFADRRLAIKAIESTEGADSYDKARRFQAVWRSHFAAALLAQELTGQHRKTA